MELFEVIKARRSVRKYLPDAVGRADLEKIVQAGIEAPTGCNMQLKQYVIVDSPGMMDSLRAVSPALTGAPAAIVVLIEPTGTKYGEFYIQDASAAIQSMLLAATAMGYGSCWVEGRVHSQEASLRTLLGVPDPLRVWAILPIGKPAEKPQRPAKPSLSDVVHFNRFGGK